VLGAQAYEHRRRDGAHRRRARLHVEDGHLAEPVTAAEQRDANVARAAVLHDLELAGHDDVHFARLVTLAHHDGAGVGVFRGQLAREERERVVVEAAEEADVAQHRGAEARSASFGEFAGVGGHRRGSSFGASGRAGAASLRDARSSGKRAVGFFTLRAARRYDGRTDVVARASEGEREAAGAMSHDALALPRPFGPYLLLRRLAVGGMAEVYVARARGISGFEKLVAIKVIHPRYSEDQHFTDLLVAEAKISVLLTHVNIGQIFDLGVVDGTYYIALEYIEGADAFRLMRKAREVGFTLPLDVCTFIAAEVCQGLAYAHRKRDAEGRPLSIVHRDISPQNVLVSFHGEVKIVDFGIAKAASRSEQTEAGVIKGKYYYMSPEQAWGDPMDHRSDIFSAGIVLYELLIGEMLYREDSIPALLDRVRRADIAPPERRRADVPPALSAIVMRALAREPERRFQSAHEMAQALVQLLYATAPSFTASRVADVMQQLFPEELQRTAELASRASSPETGELGPPSTLTAVASRAPLGGAPTRVAVRAPATRPQVPVAQASLAPAAFALGDDDDDDDRTRNDVPALQRAMAALVAGERAATAPLSAPTEPLSGAQTNTDAIEPDGVREEATRAFAAAPHREVSTRSLLTPDGAPRDVWDDEQTSVLGARRLARERSASAVSASLARDARPDEASDPGWSEESTVIDDGEAIAAARATLRGALRAAPPAPAPPAPASASPSAAPVSARAPVASARPSQRPVQARPADVRLPAPQARAAPSSPSRPPRPASVRPPAPRPRPAPSARADVSQAPAAPQTPVTPQTPVAPQTPVTPRRDASPASSGPAPAPPSASPVFAPPASFPEPWASPPTAPEPWESPPAAAPQVFAPLAAASPPSSEPWPSPPAAPEPWAAPPWAGGAASPLAVAPPREPFATGSTGRYASLVEEVGGRRRVLWLALLGLGVLATTFAGVSAFLTSRPEPKPPRVTSVPMGAQVRVDGVAVPGLTPLVLPAPLDPARPHTIDVTLDGFHPYRIEVPSGDRQPEHLAILTPR
jgi:serine/threonine protein kinase